MPWVLAINPSSSERAAGTAEPVPIPSTDKGQHFCGKGNILGVLSKYKNSPLKKKRLLGKLTLNWALVRHTSTRHCELEASLVHRVGSRATQGTLSPKPKTKQKAYRRAKVMCMTGRIFLYRGKWELELDPEARRHTC